MDQKEKNVRICCWLLLNSLSGHFADSHYMGSHKKASIMKPGEFSDILQKDVDRICTVDEYAIVVKWCDYTTLMTHHSFVSTGIISTGLFSFAVVARECVGYYLFLILQTNAILIKSLPALYVSGFTAGQIHTSLNFLISF